MIRSFLTAMECQVNCALASVKAEPNNRATSESQLLFGETFYIESQDGSWSKGFCGHDGFTGYVKTRCLSSPVDGQTHVVIAPSAPVLSAPYMHQSPRHFLSLGSRVKVTASKDQFYSIYPKGWVYRVHLKSLPFIEPDYPETAARLIGSPFVWGGRSYFGFDCCGLIQFVLQLAGVSTKRDIGDQARILGRSLDVDEGVRRGDIFYLATRSGLFHAGIFLDERSVVHTGRDFWGVGIQPFERVQKFYGLCGTLASSNRGPTSVIVRRLEQGLSLPIKQNELSR